jgi:hypothetical protein
LIELLQASVRNDFFPWSTDQPSVPTRLLAVEDLNQIKPAICCFWLVCPQI